MTENLMLSSQIQRFKQQTDTQEVDLSNGLCKNESKASQSLLKIESLPKILILHFERNDNPSILFIISHIKFSNLKRLNLQGNKIVTIEVLPFLNAPYLQELDLTKNKISNLKPLSKIRFNRIQTFKISIDSIMHGWLNICRCETYVKNILFDSFYSQKHPISHSKLQNLAKSEFNKSMKFTTNQKKKTNSLIQYLKDFKVKKKQC